MATKRPHPTTHPSRQGQVPSESRRKRQKPDHIIRKSFKKAHTVHDLKSQIRSLRRLLEHNADSLPANVRVDKERALQSAQRELAETERAKRRSEVIGRWHKVRFFERQKATKRVKKVRKALEDVGVEGDGEGVGERGDLRRRLEEAEVDVNYAIYYPLEKDYVPLFAKRRRAGEVEATEEESPEPLESERQGDAAMWELVRKSMVEGTLEALRKGKLADGQEADAEQNDRLPAVPVQPKKKRQQVQAARVVMVEGNRRERRKAAAVAKQKSDDDSEGGFFE